MRNKIIEIAQGEIGYKEYADNKTKYGEWYGVQDEWCAIFISWLANQVGILNNLIPKECYVPTMVEWFKNKLQFKARGVFPQKGDIIFFDYNANGTPDHVGIVEKLESGVITTIEGNKSKMVQRCTYNVNNSGIYGFGIVLYPEENNSSNEIIYSTIKKGSKGNLVKIAQEKLIEKGYELPIYGADGDFGTETETAVKKLQQDAMITVDGIIGPDTWSVLNGDFFKGNVPYPGHLIKKGQVSDEVEIVQTRLINLGYDCGSTGTDKKFGINTENAVKQFQKKNGLVVDGIVGPKTWEKLFS